jgi:hypothetical protein
MKIVQIHNLLKFENYSKFSYFRKNINEPVEVKEKGIGG